MNSNFKTVCFYSAEKNAITGNGKYCKTFKISNFDNLDEHIKKLRDDQKEKNKIFRQKVKKGDIIIEPPNKRLLRVFAGIPNDKVGLDNVNNEKQNNIKCEDAFEDLKIPTVKIKKSLDLKLDNGTGNTTFLLGSSKMGKTTLLMHLYEKYYNQKRFISTLFSVNSQIPLYRNHKNLLKCPEFNDKAQKLVRMEKFINMKCKNKYHFVNLFDDVIDIRYSGLINNLVLTYRNSKISSLISLQYSNLLSKCARSNINNVICFGFNTDEAIELIINTFLKSAFRKLGLDDREMVNFYKKMTKDHGFIYIHPASGSVTFHKIPLKNLIKRNK